MQELRRGTLAICLALHASVALPAADPIASTSIARYSIESFDLPLGEQVDLCSAKHPTLQSAFVSASAELRRRYIFVLTELLRTEKFEALLSVEVPQEEFLFNIQQSAMRREVNTTASQEKCERWLGEIKGMNDQFLSTAKSMFDRRSSRSPR